MKIERRNFLKKGAIGTAAIGLSGTLSGTVANTLTSRTEKIPHCFTLRAISCSRKRWKNC